MLILILTIINVILIALFFVYISDIVKADNIRTF
jgi:hypothetical protein